jgi:cysteine desulfurase
MLRDDDARGADGSRAAAAAPRVYLDWNATTPPLPEVIEAMREAAHAAWGNPSSVHADGRRARAFVEDARAAVADLVGLDPRDVVFTSGGTEANNLALRSAFPGASAGVLVTSRIEHPSITRVAEALEREGRARVHWLAIDREGRVDLDDATRVLDAGEVKLVAVSAANHETGVVQPVTELARLARAKGSLVHIDAVQAFGKLRFDATTTDLTSVSLAAHKIRGPKGLGALVTRPGARIDPVLLGGAQERGIRPGTVDPVAARGLVVAARHAASTPDTYAALSFLRDRLEGALLRLAPGSLVNGDGRMPHVSNVSVAGWQGAELVAALDLEGVSVSSGSACSAGTTEPSPVIRAIAGEARSRSAVRFSMGEATTSEEIDFAVRILTRVLARFPSQIG